MKRSLKKIAVFFGGGYIVELVLHNNECELISTRSLCIGLSQTEARCCRLLQTVDGDWLFQSCFPRDYVRVGVSLTNTHLKNSPTYSILNYEYQQRSLQR